MITPDYIEENKRLHSEIEDYGACGARNAEQVYALLNLFHPKSILDFGCGKGSLKPAVEQLIFKRRISASHGKFVSKLAQKRHSQIVNYPEWTEYDPAILGKDVFPSNRIFDMVVATDVLEHVEPDMLESVLESIRGVTGTVFFCTIGIAPSSRRLSDGRDAHLIIEDEKFWRDELYANSFTDVTRLASTRSGILTFMAM